MEPGGPERRRACEGHRACHTGGDTLLRSLAFTCGNGKPVGQHNRAVWGQDTPRGPVALGCEWGRVRPAEAGGLWRLLGQRWARGEGAGRPSRRWGVDVDFWLLRWAAGETHSEGAEWRRRKRLEEEGTMVCCGG